MISLAFESDWHQTSHRVQEVFVRFSSSVSALPIRPYAPPVTFLLTSQTHLAVSVQSSALLDTGRHAGRHKSNQFDVNVSVCTCCWAREHS